VQEQPSPPLTVATAIPKGDRVEWMVQKLTELGVSEIVFVDYARSVVSWKGERAERQLGRLRTVAREAASQSRRVWLPTLRGPVAFAEAAAIPEAALADPDGESRTDFAAVLIGPEGGLTDEERRLCRRAVSLGPQILRIETAAIAAAALISGSRR
jgi:16S rRNA (uracil1498-N3)-methyltransferase